MSFTDFETSVSAGQALRLYQFDRSATVIWRYTSADRTIHHEGYDWLPLAISDDGIRMAGEASADNLKLTLPADTPVAQLFRRASPSSEIFVTVYDYDMGASDGEVCWIGSISGASWPARDRAELSCDSLSASMKREGLRLRYERGCPHSVYDTMCSVDKALYARQITVAGLTGTHIQFDATGIADLGIYSYGAVEWSVDGTHELRGIELASAGQIEVIGGTYGLEYGQAVTIYPGCDGTRQTCNDRFANILNHGGFAHMPGDSIYGKRLW